MPTLPVSRALVIGLGLMVASLAFGATARQVEAVYQGYRVSGATLSPDGRRVVFVLIGQLQIWRTDTIANPVAVRAPSGNVQQLRWLSAEELLVISDSGLSVISVVTGETKPVDTAQVTKLDGPGRSLPRGARIIPVPDDPESVLVEFLSTGKSSIPSRPVVLEVHRLNIRTGEARRVLDYPVEREQKVGDMIADQQGEPRIVHRRGGQFFAYHDEQAPQGNVNVVMETLETLFSDFIGWTPLTSVLKDNATFRFSLQTEAIMTERTIPLGFGSDRDELIYASNLGRDVFGIYAADLRTGARKELAVEVPGVDLVDPGDPWLNPPLVYDRARKTLVGVRLRDLTATTRWFDRELAETQAEIERQFPRREVQILEWDERRIRFLVLIGGISDPGRYFIHHRPNKLATEYYRRAPGVTLAESNPTEAFAFVSPAGVRITGYLTRPRNPPPKGAPGLIMALHDGPWERAEPEYDRDAQALATMGFVVVKINYRGSTGFGIAHREAIRTALDTAPLDDAVATLDWLRRERRIDTRRAGLLGEGFGGYLALRGLQLHPDLFHAAATINAPTNPLQLSTTVEELASFQAEAQTMSATSQPRAQFKPYGARIGLPPDLALKRWLLFRQDGLRSIDVLSDLDLLTQPILLLQDPERKQDTSREYVEMLRDGLRRRGRTADWMEISSDFARETSRERAAGYRRIGEFFNLTLFAFTVKIGDLEAQPDGKAPPKP